MTLTTLKFEAIKVGDQLPSRDHTATSAQLFMYNAVIWNSHRIHYDQAYAVDQEGYPGLVIDGPLQGDWLCQVVTDWIGEQAALASFGYANRKVAFLGETMTAGGEVETVDLEKREITVKLFLKNQQDEVTIPGQAVVRFG